MTFNKYKRLTIVLFFPLLCLGALTVYLQPEIYSTSRILCAPNPTLRVVCRSEQFAGEEIFKAFSDKQPEERIHVYTDQRSVGRKQIEITAVPISATATVTSYATPLGTLEDNIKEMEQLVGKEVAFVFNPNDYEYVAQRPEFGIPLKCSEMYFMDGSSTLGSGCLVGEAHSRLNGTVSGEFAIYVRVMRDLISYEIDWMKKEDRDKLYFKYLFTLPLYIYLYLFISAIVWLVMRSYRYVKNG